jgi:hypothetical protein
VSGHRCFDRGVPWRENGRVVDEGGNQARLS